MKTATKQKKNCCVDAPLSHWEEMARQIHLNITNLQNVCLIISAYLGDRVCCANKLEERENAKLEGAVCVITRELGEVSKDSRVLCENIENYGINKRRGKNG